MLEELTRSIREETAQPLRAAPLEPVPGKLPISTGGVAQCLPTGQDPPGPDPAKTAAPQQQRCTPR
jgi:hypothetical protein